jgi:hypothetical protein
LRYIKIDILFVLGVIRGLQLELFVGKPEYYESFSTNVGAQLFIYNQSTVYSETEGTEVAAGFETSIAITKKISETLLYPYSDCQIKGTDSVSTNGGTSYRYLQAFEDAGYKYRSENCMDHCYQDTLHDKCGCIDFYYQYFNLKNESISKFCDMIVSSVDSKCMENNINENLFESCVNYCPFECDSVKYLTSISFSDYPSRTATTMLLKSSNFLANRLAQGTDITSEILKVNVFYDSMSYEYLNDSAALTLVSLLGGLGGTLGNPDFNFIFSTNNLILFCFSLKGLFLGFSVLSICEFVDLIVSLIIEANRKTQINSKCENFVIA